MECGRMYIGQTGRSVGVRLKEHQCHIQMEHPHKSDVAEHGINSRHHILFQDASNLTTSSRQIHGPHCEGSS
jgi:hypothetical protein